MKTYLNRGGNSNVKTYIYGEDYITVQFSTGNPYTYSYASAGSDKVEHMKNLADAGVGLNSFINTKARNDYVK
jgi:hypothetical protein